VIGRACTARDTRDEETQGWAAEDLGENAQGLSCVVCTALIYCTALFYRITANRQASSKRLTTPPGQALHGVEQNWCRVCLIIAAGHLRHQRLPDRRRGPQAISSSTSVHLVCRPWRSSTDRLLRERWQNPPILHAQ
jgi:hypothetical protein